MGILATGGLIAPYWFLVHGLRRPPAPPRRQRPPPLPPELARTAQARELPRCRGVSATLAIEDWSDSVGTVRPLGVGQPSRRPDQEEWLEPTVLVPGRSA